MSHTLLYGGTFDPIHHGHLITSRRAKELLSADRVLFIPARMSPHKTGEPAGATGQERLAMIELAIAGVPGFVADGRELARPGGGPSYTIDTIEELLREQPAEHLTLLIGADQLPKLHTWRRIADLLAPKTAGGHEIALAILARLHNAAAPDTTHALRQVQSHLGQAVADRLAKAFLDTPHIDISATDIRHRISRGLPIDFLVPSPVAAYIHAHRLYRP